MLQSCLNELRKRTTDWAEIRMAIEDQLTVQRNWNLHPNNQNADWTEGPVQVWRRECNLGKTGQVRMEINAVTNQYRTVRSSTQLPTLLWLGHQNSLRSVRTNSTTWGIGPRVTNLDTWRETGRRKPELKSKLRAAIKEDRKEKLSASTVIRRDTWPEIAGDPKRTKDGITSRIQRRQWRSFRKCWWNATVSRRIFRRGNDYRTNCFQ